MKYWKYIMIARRQNLADLKIVLYGSSLVKIVCPSSVFSASFLFSEIIHKANMPIRKLAADMI